MLEPNSGLKDFKKYWSRKQKPPPKPEDRIIVTGTRFDRRIRKISGALEYVISVPTMLTGTYIFATSIPEDLPGMLLGEALIFVPYFYLDWKHR